jgi:AraC-like DNA-binding protein
VSRTPREDHASAAPRPELRPYVAHYGGSIRSGFARREHAATPSRHVTLIVSFGAPIEVIAMPEGRQAPGRFQSFAAGLHAAPARVRDDGTTHVLHAFLTPLGARTLFGVPAEALASRVVSLEDLLGPRARELEERLANARDWAGRFAAIDDVLARKLEPVEPAPQVAWAWRRLVAAQGGLAIDSLARELGWSRRHLAERFRREVGLTPKAAARVLRWERACALLARPGRRPTLAGVAADCGYADQSHLTREWVALSGLTPRAWLADELPFLQDYELDELLSYES